MKMRTLIPSYLKHNHIDTLRYQLCDIIYSDYKGRTFFLNHILEQKKIVLQKVTHFFDEYPEIYQYKNNSSYWYPYENVSPNKNLDVFTTFYPNIQNEITYFNRENEEEQYEYLFDPVKLLFFVMCQDIKDMDCSSDIAKEIIQINNELFRILTQAIGDTINYSGINNIEHIENYIKDHKDYEIKVMNDTEYDADYKTLLLRKCRNFNSVVYILNDAISISREDQLQQQLIEKPESKIVKNKV